MKRARDYLKNSNAVTAARDRAVEEFPPDDIHRAPGAEFHHFLLLLCLDYIDAETVAKEIEHAFELMKQNRRSR